MSKRDGWKAFFGSWANSLRRRRPARPAPASRPVRLEMLEPRNVLTALVPDVGTNLEIVGVYGIVEGGYDIISLEPTDLNLDGSNSTGDGPFTYEWDIDPNPSGLQPTIEDPPNSNNIIPNPLFVADFVNPPLSTPIVGVKPAVTWTELNTRGITTGTPFLHDAIISLRVTDSHNVSAIVSGTLQVSDFSPFLLSSTVTPSTAGCGQPAATLDMTFGDLNPSDVFTAYVTWDSSGPSPVEVVEPVTSHGDGTFTIHASNTYASAGLKAVSVRVVADPNDLENDQIVDFYAEDEVLGGGFVTVTGGGGGGPTTASISGSSSGSEGTPIALTGTVDQPCGASPTTYAWSVAKDNNPTPFATGNTANFSFTPDDNGSYVVTLTATDAGGPVAAAPTTITVNNVNPTVGPLSAAQAAAVGCTLADVTLNGSFTDPGILDTFTVNVNWGDGPAAPLPAGNITLVSPGHYTFSATHHYAATGSKSISVSVADNYSGPGAAPGTGTTTASVAIGAATTACLDTSTHTLVVTGSSGTDWVHINAPSGSVRVQSNFLSGPLDFPSGGVTNVVILLGGGDDVLTVAGNVTLNILAVGGDGIDTMTGGRGRNVLIGGDGADVLFGGRGEDVLIDSSTIYDANELALMAILNEWSSNLGVNQRIAHLSNQIGGVNQVAGIYFFLNSSSIIDDNDIDILTGNQSTDWLLLHSAIEAIGGNQDVITDL